nr:MAG TPA: hypothetical protein [Caudoviricetes sp.]
MTVYSFSLIVFPSSVPHVKSPLRRGEAAIVNVPFGGE